MTTLYNLVKFRNELTSTLKEISLRSEIDNKINLLNNIIQNNEEFPHLSKIEELKNSYSYLLENDQQRVDTIKTFIDQLSNEIVTLGSTKSNTGTFVEETIKAQLILDDITKNKISSKISQYSSTRYPGLQILAREKQWIVPMVACDPLYLTRDKRPDSVFPSEEYPQYFPNLYPEGNGSKFVQKTRSELQPLEEMLAEYPDSYQRRVGLYTILNRDFSVLPQNQFGFVLCWDNFDYLTCEIIQQYLQEVFKLLRPGGVFMFSYTNCEVDWSALKVDYQSAAYCSSSWVSKVLAEIGYEVITLVDHTSIDNEEVHPISWAEVRKPGTLSTAKLSQAQGLVNRK